MEFYEEKPKTSVVIAAIILAPLVLLYVFVILPILKWVVFQNVNRRHKKLFGRPMNEIEKLLYDLNTYVK